jgi:hypothetical protein
MHIVSTLVMKQTSETRVIRTWRSGGNSPSNSILFTIPAEFAREYHLSEPTNVLVIPTDQGLLLRKLEVSK